MNKENLFVFGAVALVAMVALVLNSSGGLEGAVFTEDQLCTDDDPEDDFFKPGTVKVTGKEYQDYCMGDTLFQQFCRTGKDAKTRRGYDCPNGCLNGACIR